MNLDFKLNYKNLDFLENGDDYVIDIETNEIFRLTEKGLRMIKPYLNNFGRLQIAFCKNSKVKNYYLHRVIYESHFGKIPEGFVIDHIDRNPLNNNISNLRLATRSLSGVNTIRKRKEKDFEYKEDIGEFKQINDDIYYSKTYRKFYRKIVNEFRSMNIYKQKNNNSFLLHWRKDNKQYNLVVTDYVLNNLVDY